MAVTSVCTCSKLNIWTCSWQLVGTNVAADYLHILLILFFYYPGAAFSSGLFFQKQLWMQYKHFLFNDFNILCSLLLPDITFISTNTAYIYMKLLMTSLWQDNYFIVCACLSFIVTLWCGLVGKSTSLGSFKGAKTFFLLEKLVIKLQTSFFSIFLLSTERNHIFHWFFAIDPCFHIVLKNILA